ncbi:FAD-dependent monooxygenase [Pseudahrensia aquimaris]|uniref:FAD-dependent monooxygenase n=1 Tax=Pseudahrensia aquimaris TaxID=744461 RepID=A0ABW3FF34_9HYPH
MTIVETDVLIVGTGPAGGTAALALATYGVDCIAVSQFGGPSRTPRAHITNQRTMEVLRDLGVEEEAKQFAQPQEMMANNVFCTSLAGEELGRIHSWGNHPQRRADYELASPSSMCDLPQNFLEPVLINNAVKRGANIRFNTEFVSHEQDATGVTAKVVDKLTGQEYSIRAKYLIGADGGNSKVVEQAGLPLAGKMGVAGSMNIIFEADLSAYVAHRPSVLYCIIQPGANVGGVGMGILRMIKPWKRWMVVYGYDLAEGAPEMTDDFAKGIVRSLVGVDDLDVEIDSTSLWTVNNCWAETLSKGRVFAVGDAVHRHPPTNGLGSNTSVQDSYNLAWKLAYILKGFAGEKLLESYNDERAPVAEQIVSRAGRSIGEYGPIFGALGLADAADVDAMKKGIEARKDNTSEGKKRRADLRSAIRAKDYEYNAHGVELNQRYVSTAVHAGNDVHRPFQRCAELYYQPSSAPGAKLPHVWLNRRSHKVSTLDVVGGGSFTLLTGIGGDAWVEAANQMAKRTGVTVKSVQIGPGCDYDDMFGDWSDLSEIDEDGCLLVRPDGYVAWRSKTAPGVDGAQQINSAFDACLSLAT